MYNPRREEEILQFWNEKQIFQKSLEKTKNKDNPQPYVFYDGPPFATGLPHFGHMLPTTLKDIVPRYQTMRGKYVPRVWGWDCHGLPIENLVEKKLGLKNKKDIEEYGIEKFNIEARNNVLQFADEWKKIIPRLGRWVDMDHDYRTMNPSFTESVWWSFKSMQEKGLVYEGFKSMHFCPHCETVLSNFEVGQGYKDITDISVYVAFRLVKSNTNSEDEYVIAWTTTPWTLPGNVALALHADTQYVKVKSLGKIYLLAKERLEALKERFGEYEIVEEIKGSDLVGLSYEPVFTLYSSDQTLANKENGWKIYAADFVTTTDGTGVVHIAPAFGEDDLNLGNKEKLPFIQHVGTDGKFKEEVTGFAGMPVKPKSDDTNGHQKADVEIIKYLAGKNALFAKEKLVHPYPHCWRCGTPLLNYATSSWFIQVSQFKDKLVEANKGVKWNPGHVGEGRFGKWLENARDWSISRSRYWGAPLPIWKSENGKEIEIIGSLDELKSKIKRNTFTALRHGEADHNVKRIMNSSNVAPSHLTEKGKGEVILSAENLKGKNIDVIFASPLYRTQQTAEIVKEQLNFTGEVIFDDRIKEETFGDYEDKTLEEYSQFYKGLKSREERISLKLPNGESLLDVRARVSDFLYDIDSKYEGKNILIIAHDGIIKMLEAVSRGGTMQDLLSIWNGFYFFLNTAETRLINFAQLPRNELFELDLHRPYIDNVMWKSESGQTMRRIKDVFDTWYDSGSMPYASKHYPFENKEAFEKGEIYPADFIAEGIDQTRGWFYSLIVLGVGLFNKAPYKNVVVNGQILAEDGRKMSKSLNNYPPIIPTVEKYGADSLRYFLASSPVIKGEDVNFSEKSLDEIVKKHFNRLYNILSLYDMYKEKVSSTEALENAYEKSSHPLDMWALALLRKTRAIMTQNLDAYEFDKATKPIGDFIDDLSTWYVRRSRDRFKNGESEEEKLDRDRALSTTRYILFEFSKLMAPFLPFMAEDMYLKLKSDATEESVHLCEWPEYEVKKSENDDEAILKSMEEVRKTVTLGLELRAKAGIKVRQPLSRLMLREDTADISEDQNIIELIKDEVNVKEVIFDANISEAATLDTEITEHLRREGIAREIIRTIQEARKEKDLSPEDKIEVVITSEAVLHHIVSEYKEIISKTASVTNFIFEEAGEAHFTIRIV